MDINEVKEVKKEAKKMNKQIIQPISLDKLDKFANGQVVEISGWYGDTILVRLKPVDVTEDLAKVSEALPNTLKKEAQEVFEGKKDASPELQKAVNSKFDNKDMPKKLDLIAKLALVEPTYEEITSRLPLMPQQKLEIWAWVMGGLEGLKSFRKQSVPNGGVGSNK